MFLYLTGCSEWIVYTPVLGLGQRVVHVYENKRNDRTDGLLHRLRKS